ncbi:MAG: alginate lyase family protein [Bacteroidota bacterium]
MDEGLVSSSQSLTSLKKGSLIFYRIGRLIRTLSDLRPVQTWYLLWYRLANKFSKTIDRNQSPKTKHTNSINWSSEKRKPSLILDEHHTFPQIANYSFLGKGRFDFLKISHNFKHTNHIDWNYSGHGKLWTYNLNYFEFLRQKDITLEDGIELIEDWINKSHKLKDAWEPYPTSVRIVHWLCFYAEARLEVPAHVYHSLYHQYKNLSKKIEYHLQANHLLENAIALTLGSYFFNETKMWKKATHLLKTELKKQYRPEGAHYELSTMYHIILLWRQLDLYAFIVAENTRMPEQNSLVIELKSAISNQLRWLDYITDSAGQYPHFNDSTYGIAPMTHDIFSYATTLKINWERADLNNNGRFKVQTSAGSYIATLNECSFAYIHRIWNNSNLYIDVGSIEPKHQPGHAHADNLNFCLFNNGKRIIVDPGISTYEVGTRRTRERSTYMHNTVSVDGQNSSEIWSSFRCGKKAKTKVIECSEAKIIAQHNGYKHLHRRSFSIKNESLTITDKYPGSADLCIHFHPRIEPLVVNEKVYLDTFELSFDKAEPLRIEEYDYALGYNKCTPAKKVVITFTDSITTNIRGV